MYENIKSRLAELENLTVNDDGMGVVRISTEGIAAIKRIASDAYDAIDDLTKNITPVTHGRTIDADALKVALVFAESTANWSVPSMREVLTVIDNMPTILPAKY